MSMELMVKAMNAKVGNPLRKLVLIKLADNSNDKGECWPSYHHIADQCEISRRSVMNHVDALIQSGFLKKMTRKGSKVTPPTSTLPTKPGRTTRWPTASAAALGRCGTPRQRAKLPSWYGHKEMGRLHRGRARRAGPG